MKIEISQRSIGDDDPCFISAEIGINHNGDMALAHRTIDAAVDAGADGVKFQNYRTEDFINNRSLTYKYWSQGKRVVEPQFAMFKRYELQCDQLAELKSHCRERGVVFHSTPTSEETLRDLLALPVALLKNGSDYLTHLPLIRAMGETGLPTLLSTGMANETEVAEAVAAFRETGNEQLVLLHCTSAYPTPPSETNLRAILGLRSRFDCLSGFSDHTESLEAAVGAVALGACILEKHFTLDSDLPGPDHPFSATPTSFRAMVQAVRAMEVMLGNAAIAPTKSEHAGRESFRLSCVAARDLPPGHQLQAGDLEFSRPGTGLPPAQAVYLHGCRLKIPVECGQVIQIGDCE